jgi:hypothetical protein
MLTRRELARRIKIILPPENHRDFARDKNANHK